jgi:tetratricopeptide (TPR) repeat protein
VAFDRNGTIRNAEKQLRQGKLDAAIGEYLRVLEDQPTDWNTANVLGDVYVRANQNDKALEQFLKVAESLREEGQMVKAAALYKKILKLQPDNERALMEAAELVANQGLYADARAYLNVVLEKRRAAKDVRGAAMARVRLGSLDPNDYAARLDGARARLEMNDVNGAVAELTTVADELAEKARYDEAIEALKMAVAADPENGEVSTKLFDLYVSSENFAQAAVCATTAAQFVSIADSLELRERHDDAVQMLRRAVEMDAEDKDLRVRVAKALLERGDVQGASELLTMEAAGDDPQLMIAVAEVQLRSGKLDDGIAVARTLIERDPSRREEVASLGWSVAQHAPEAGFALVELSAEAAVASNDWAAAAVALQEYVTRVPTFIPALMRLVEVCVDGGIETMMYSAQAQLADAYIETGAVAEARFIAEDLVAREPWERANIERFRRALEMLGETDPDSVIAARLSGESPFMTTDLLSPDESGADEEAAETHGLSPELLAMLEEAEGSDLPGPASRDAPRESEPVVSVAGLDDSMLPEFDAHQGNDADSPGAEEELARKRASVLRMPPSGARKKSEPAPHFELSSNGIDFDDLFGDLEVPAPAKRKASADEDQENVEVDLSVDLDGINASRTSGSPTPPRPSSSTSDSDAATELDADAESEPEFKPFQEHDLDSVFAQLRSQASQRSTGDGADEQMAQGLALQEAGTIEEAIQAFELASRSPRHRFQASLQLGRIYRDSDRLPKAIEWFERATQAPGPTPEEGFTLLYELADALEVSGETARALAVCLEILASAGDFRDVKARVARLNKVQARG